MKTRALYAVLSLLTALVLTTSPAAAQQAEDRGSSEAIQVHGDWTIEVYDGDELVERREFENDLRSTGAARLVELIMGEVSITNRAIEVSTDLCLDGGETRNVIIFWPARTTSSPCDLNTLNESSSIDRSSVESNSITLEGAFTADVDGSVTGVETLLYVESESTFSPLTDRQLTPIDVVEGQEVRVTVVITFG